MLLISANLVPKREKLCKNVAKEVYLLFNMLSPGFHFSFLSDHGLLKKKKKVLSFLSKNLKSLPSSSRVWFLLHLFALVVLHLFLALV